VAPLPSGDRNKEFLRAVDFVDSVLPRERALKVFAAEAGAEFTIRRPAYVVGVNVQQAERTRRQGADEYRTANLERIELEGEEYDVVLCCNVLEHVPCPLAVLPAFWEGLKYGGLLVIMAPNVTSLKGLMTRLTPLAFHRWYYTRVAGWPPEKLPAPAVHSLSLRPRLLSKHARNGGWKVEYWRLYEGGVQKTLRYRIGIVGWRWRVVVGLTRALSLGLVTAERTGLIAVLRKTAIVE
jgi:SAM-dependent methyltransferase